MKSKTVAFSLLIAIGSAVGCDNQSPQEQQVQSLQQRAESIADRLPDFFDQLITLDTRNLAGLNNPAAVKFVEALKQKKDAVVAATNELVNEFDQSDLSRISDSFDIVETFLNNVNGAIKPGMSQNEIESILMAEMQRVKVSEERLDKKYDAQRASVRTEKAFMKFVSKLGEIGFDFGSMFPGSFDHADL